MWYTSRQVRFNVAIIMILLVTLAVTSQLIVAQNNIEQNQSQVEHLSQFDNLYDCITPTPVCPDPEDCEVNNTYENFDTFEECITPMVTISPDCIIPPPICPDPEDCQVGAYGSFDTFINCVTPTPSISPTSTPICPDPEDCDFIPSSGGLDFRSEDDSEVFVPSNLEPCEIFTYVDCETFYQPEQ